MSKNGVVYENVRVEMARKRISILDISQKIGMNRETLSRKLSGKSPMRIEEAFAIQQSCFPDTDIQTLFKECNTGK